MLSDFLRGWTMRSSTSLALCLPLLFKYMLNLFFFSFFSFSLFVMTSNVGNCNRGDLLLVSPLILHTSFGLSMLVVLMALLKSVPCPIILMSWAILSFLTLERWVFFPFVLSLFAKFLFLSQSLFLPSLNYSPLSKTMRSWCG